MPMRVCEEGSEWDAAMRMPLGATQVLTNYFVFAKGCRSTVTKHLGGRRRKQGRVLDAVRRNYASNFPFQL